MPRWATNATPLPTSRAIRSAIIALREEGERAWEQGKVTELGNVSATRPRLSQQWFSLPLAPLALNRRLEVLVERFEIDDDVLVAATHGIRRATRLDPVRALRQE